MTLFGWSAAFAVFGAITIGVDLPWTGTSAFAVAVCLLVLAMYFEQKDEK